MLSILQRSLHDILLQCPVTASSDEFCLLCCQFKPFPRSQDTAAYTAAPLQNTCLTRVHYPHALQDVESQIVGQNSEKKSTMHPEIENMSEVHQHDLYSVSGLLSEH
jgi:hypothetical protein